MPFHRKLLFSLLESYHHGELLGSISWRTINSRELLVSDNSYQGQLQEFALGSHQSILDLFYPVGDPPRA